MTEYIPFLDIFMDYQPPEILRVTLSQAAVARCDVDSVNRIFDFELLAPRYISRGDIRTIQSGLVEVYHLTDCIIDEHYDINSVEDVTIQELRDMFCGYNPMARGVLAGASCQWADGEVTVQLRGNGKEHLKDAVKPICSKLSDMFGCNVTMNIQAGKELEGQALYEELDRIRMKAYEASPKAAPAKTEHPKQQEELSAFFYGKPFRGKTVTMKSVDLNSGFVVIEGKVIHVDHKELPKAKAVVVKFDMTDNTSAIRVSRYMSNREAQPVLEKVSVGAVLRVYGRMIMDTHTNEYVFTPKAMTVGSMPVRRDLAQGQKRVELHLHTTMSNMDALTVTKDAIKRAAAWGHKAIAITDHGCVQSFTDALHVVEPKEKAPKVAGTDEPIKILYGCEGYYINDVDDKLVVQGQQDHPLDEEFVAFDFETTGLYPQRDTIIEIGAVLMRGGKEVDRFSTLVNPRRPLNPYVSELTGITDEMLATAPDIETVFPQFVEFLRGKLLVAHNADFDTAFLAAECKRQGIELTFTSFDTLTASQNLLPKKKKYNLDVVAKHFALDDFEHHRASDDALVCGKIMCELVSILKDRGICQTHQVNEAMIPLRKEFRSDASHNQHIVLFAKNQLGLRNLYRLISEANLYHFLKKPRILKSELMKFREGIIVGSACENNELFQAVISGRRTEELERLAAFYDYLEVQPISNNRFMLTPKKEGEAPIATDDEYLRDFNRTVVALGQKLGKMVVATGDVHFLDPEDEVFRHVLLTVNDFSDADKSNPLYFRTTDEMLDEFSYLGADVAREIVVTNPNLIADMCDQIRPVPHNLFAPSIENSVEDLKSLVYGKFHRLYGDNPPQLFAKRVETELNDIISCHYDVIYMSAQRLVQNSLENGYLVGSRGSVGSSIVAYMSGITEVNSFPPHYRCPNPNCKHTVLDVPKEFNCGADLPDADCPKCGTKMEKDGFNIPFETFLGFGGDKVPDIDLNFSGEYQAKAHAYCTEMFGKSHVFRAGTIGTVAEKTAFGYAKKYLEKRGETASNAEQFRLASGCVGVRRTTGQHPGGLVVIPQENEIWDFCPVQHPADDPKSDQITTHFEYHSMEENLLKLDMLGHDDPTMIRMMEDMTGVDAKTIPLDDKDTMSIFTSSKVLGYENDPLLGPTGAVAVPEFNTRFTRGVLLDTMPDKFDFLVRISGYTHGTDVWLGNARDLIMSKTTTVDGTIGCRDDIMLYLISCGLPEKRAFKIMESVRKGRGLPDGAEQEMIDAGVPDWYIGSCKKIKYLFPKAHAVAYVMMAFRIAWFKVNYPLAFYAAFFYRRGQKGGFDASLMTRGMAALKANIDAIDNNPDASEKDQDLLTTMEVVYEFYLRGFEFLPIDIYKSHAIKYLVEDGKIRPPFASISGLGDSAAISLMEGREGKHFMSIEEVAAACPKVSKTHIQMLKNAGAFGDLPDTNQVSLF